MRPRRLALLPLALLPWVAGCEETRTVGKKAKAPPAARAVPPPAQARAGTIVGQTTTAIKDAAPEIQSGKAYVSSGKITAKDPITVTGNAYVSIVGRTSVFKIQQALDLYYTENQRYPADLAEFMDQIIKPNNISLPRLPDYQEYAYDAPNHRLVVLEYPDRKAAPAR
jgi:hypothetical protein